MRRRFKNGVMSLFKSYCVRSYDGEIFRLNDYVYDVLQIKPLGRIEKFISQYGYIKAIVNGNSIDIDNIHRQ